MLMQIQPVLLQLIWTSNMDKSNVDIFLSETLIETEMKQKFYFLQWPMSKTA